MNDYHLSIRKLKNQCHLFQSFIALIVQSSGDVEYTDCIPAEG